jgi:tripartite-type tricarboxylate transporter receptor subunit TctC
MRHPSTRPLASPHPLASDTTPCRKRLPHPRQLLASLVAACLLTGVAGAPARAADEPAQRPIRLIVPQAPGGGTDIIARHVVQFFSENLRQPAIVENRVGGGSLAGTDYVAKAAPDGYTLLLGGVSPLAINPAIFRNLPYDAMRDFTALGFLSAYPFVLVARTDLPVSSLADLARLARANPGKYSYASAGLGTVQHVWGAILMKSLGLDMVHVPYKGAAQAVQDMMGGRVDVMFDNLSAERAHIDGGRLRALAVSSQRRVPAFASVPTVEETGLVRFVGESWFGVFAPSGTPAPIVERHRASLAALVAHPAFIARIENDSGRTMPIPASEQQAFLRSEAERWARLIAQYGVVAE